MAKKVTRAKKKAAVGVPLGGRMMPGGVRRICTSLEWVLA